MEKKVSLLKVLYILFLPIAIMGETSCSGKSAHRQLVDSHAVYICTGPQSKRYHSTPDCKGLRRCSAEIEAVSIEEAEADGRTPCRWCR